MGVDLRKESESLALSSSKSLINVWYIKTPVSICVLHLSCNVSFRLEAQISHRKVTHGTQKDYYRTSRLLSLEITHACEDYFTHRKVTHGTQKDYYRTSRLLSLEITHACEDYFKLIQPGLAQVSLLRFLFEASALGSECVCGWALSWYDKIQLESWAYDWK